MGFEGSLYAYRERGCGEEAAAHDCANAVQAGDGAVVEIERVHLGAGVQAAGDAPVIGFVLDARTWRLCNG